MNVPTARLCFLATAWRDKAERILKLYGSNETTENVALAFRTCAEDLEWEVENPGIKEDDKKERQK